MAYHFSLNFQGKLFMNVSNFAIGLANSTAQALDFARNRGMNDVATVKAIVGLSAIANNQLLQGFILSPKATADSINNVRKELAKVEDPYKCNDRFISDLFDLTDRVLDIVGDATANGDDVLREIKGSLSEIVARIDVGLYGQLPAEVV